MYWQMFTTTKGLYWKFSYLFLFLSQFDCGWKSVVADDRIRQRMTTSMADIHIHCGCGWPYLVENILDKEQEDLCILNQWDRLECSTAGNVLQIAISIIGSPCKTIASRKIVASIAAIRNGSKVLHRKNIVSARVIVSSELITFVAAHFKIIITIIDYLFTYLCE